MVAKSHPRRQEPDPDAISPGGDPRNATYAAATGDVGPNSAGEIEVDQPAILGYHRVLVGLMAWQEQGTMDLSIIIPAYEEQDKIARDVRESAEFLVSHRIRGHIIVVDDGSRDGTAEVARSALPQPPDGVFVEVIRHAQNRGKGFAVRTGVQRATGDFVMFADSGSCVPYEETLRGLELIKSGQCEIAHGSRKMVGCRIEHGQPFHRRVCGNFFRWFVKWLMGIPMELTDTQCGFKIYRGDVARRLYSRAVTDGSVFDIEVIMRAREAGYRIREFPLRWVCDPDSRHSIITSLWRFPRELWTIRRALRSEEGVRSG